MDNTTNNTAAWAIGIIVVLAVLLGIWLLATNTGTTPSTPNTGASSSINTDTSGSGTTGTGTPSY
jgi:hypothetical protein